MRIEKDSLGEKEVPEEVYYGIHTLRSMDNFGAAGDRLPLDIIYAMAQLKWACAQANKEIGLLDTQKCDAISAACLRVIRGEVEDQFPLDAFQAGSGTSSNMNVNEVISNLACEELGGKKGERNLVHPNDDVNKGQSTNNVFPSAIRVACVEQSNLLLNELQKLIEALSERALAFEEVIKSGRTHLQDAVPLTLGQEFGAYARALNKDVVRIQQAQEKLLELGVGGNAVGTGVNTKPVFRETIICYLNKLTQEKYRTPEDGIEITQFLTDMAEASSALRATALDILKIGNDLRLLTSGPNTGFQEIVLPPVEPGSSIMPGKINPSIVEASNMACLQVLGNDHSVSVACGLGQLELNTHMPLVGYNLIKSFRILERCCRMLTQKCIPGIKANVETCTHNLQISAGLPTILNPILGYDRVAELVKESLATKKTLKDLVLEKNILSADEFGELMKTCTGPNL
ncbi:MAG: aspartate ammonia-lyase [Kiritimatiellae bacterium]|nr:aspartate ammonia-lyase [Kiritimatiellia bacterium]